MPLEPSLARFEETLEQDPGVRFSSRRLLAGRFIRTLMPT